MLVYHGTDIDSAYKIKSKIVVGYGSKSVDFGPGFYVTPDYETAKKWAIRKSIFRRKKPVVVILEFDEVAASGIIKKFDNDLMWGKFIVNNRNGQEYIDCVTEKINNLDAKFDIVYGRIADYDTIDIANALKEEKKELVSGKELINPYYSFQYSFHTEKGIEYLSVQDKYDDFTNGGMKSW